MRVFVFAIGGTGSRVLTSLIMQLAAGVRPIDSDGKPISELSIVPIIVDPHESNDGLLNVISLLNDYRDIRKKIYGNRNDAQGFFSVKIETLSDISSQVDSGSDQFFFSMPHVSDNKFGKFINLDDLDLQNRLLMEMLFSPEELNTYMKEGFYGSPNIGCVALNEFRKSKDFEAFRSAFNSSEDRIFFIGSIFGGTGASGLPLFVSSIRDLSHADNMNAGNMGCAQAPIGALIVMPYFSIEKKDASPIDDNDFIIKSKSALRYYADNLNKYVNCIYYIADTDRPKSFENDPGNVNNQKGNKAHIVEFIGATAILDFISINADDLRTTIDSNGRQIATRTKYKQYSFEHETSQLTFEDLPSSTNSLCMMPLMKFYLLKLYMNEYLTSRLNTPFASKYEPKIESSILSRELKSFFNRFEKWIDDMQQHGSSAHNLTLFSSPIEKDLTTVFNGVQPRKRTFGKKTLKISDLESALNDSAQKHDKMQNQFQRWFTIADEAFGDAINDNLIIEGF